MKNIKSKSKKKDVFTSKADVLNFLNSNLKNSKIEKIYSFVVDDWKKNREEICILLFEWGKNWSFWPKYLPLYYIHI